MIAQRLVFSLLLTFLLTLGGTPSRARASDQWCDDDPPVVLHTPGGALVTVYVTDGGLGLPHLPAVQLAHITADVSPAGSGTRVHVQVLVPGDAFDPSFATRSTVSTGPFATGAIYATASGVSGHTMAMTFTIPLA